MNYLEFDDVLDIACEVLGQSASSMRRFAEEYGQPRLPIPELDDQPDPLLLLQLADPSIDTVEFAEARDDDRGPSREIRFVRSADEAPVAFGLDQESAGTRTWFRLIGPVLTALQRGGVLLHDEIDASLHPRLSAELLGLFHDPETNPHGAQLVFTTHDVSLLDHLNRDEVWLTEKDDDGMTQLVAPRRVWRRSRVRKSVNLERAYMQGRFGAVPEVDQSGCSPRPRARRPRPLMARRQRRRGHGLKRRTGIRSPRRTFVILCEGTVTEPHYLDALKRLPEVHEIASVKIEVDKCRSGAVPLTLVEAAIEVKNGNDEIDEVWCLFDVEAPQPHPNLAQALNRRER